MAGSHRGIDLGLVVTDLDGTLLDENNKVSGANRRALERVSARGVPVVVCTGRSDATALAVVKGLKLGHPVICYNGACILGREEEGGTRPVLLSFPLPREVNRAIFALAEEHGFAVNVYDDDVVYVACKNERHRALVDRYAALTECEYKLVEDYSHWHEREVCGCTCPSGGDAGIVDAVPAAHAIRRAQVYKILVLTGEDQAEAFLAEADAFLKARGIDAHLIHGEYFVEFLRPGAHKGAALTWLASHMGVATERVVAFGDGSNDQQMLATAGMGIAMRNAKAPTKKAARRISPWAHHEDAVARELELLFPKPNDCAVPLP